MKTWLVSFLTVGALSASLSAFAGPDWQIIEKARAAKQDQAAAEVFNGKVSSSGTAAAGGTGCMNERRVLPLDHGPRSEATPALNAQRRMQDQERRQACGEHTGK